MLEIRQVTIQLRPPSGRLGDYGLVALGNYTVEDNVLTMVDDDGKPLRQKGKVVKHTLADGENAETIARKLTLDIVRLQPDKDGFDPLF